MPQRMSANRLLKYQNCRREYDLHYNRGIRAAVTAANLVFGKAIHAAIEAFLRARACGSDAVDPVQVFTEHWDAALEEEELDFSTAFTPEEMRETGQVLMGQFPDWWDRQGWMPLMDPDGEPLIEPRLTGKIGPVPVVGFPDLIAMDLEGRVVAPDFKTPAQPSLEGFEKVSDQLILYTELLQQNADWLGIRGLEFRGAGFVELLKKRVPKTRRGTGPTIEEPRIAPPPSAELRREFKERLLDAAEGIAAERFPRDPRMPHNSPCGMCDYQSWCFDGDPDGLVFPEQEQEALV